MLERGARLVGMVYAYSVRMSTVPYVLCVIIFRAAISCNGFSMKEAPERPDGWVAMRGIRPAGVRRSTRAAAEKDAEKLGEGAWVAPVRG